MAEEAEAAPAFDVSQLSTAQQEALQLYTDVTSQNVKEAIPLLQRSEWNVHIAIAKFFDGEGPDPVAEAIAAQDNIPRIEPRVETLQGGYSDYMPHHPAGGPGNTDPAPRVVPRQPVNYRPPFLIALLFAPFQLGYGVFATLFKSVYYILSFLPAPLRPRAVTRTIGGLRNASGRRMLLPQDTATRFKIEFQEEYGDHDLPFFEGGFAQALDEAKRDLKFLLLVLMSPEHDDTESWVKDTLLSPEVVQYVSDPGNKILLWGGNVLDSEAYQVSLEYSATKYPFSAVVCLTPKEGSTRMGIAKRLVGPMTPQQYITGIQEAISQHAPDLDAVRLLRESQAVTRNLRTEQDTAYERSLARDRERARQRREAEAEKAAAEKRAQEEKEAAEQQAERRQQWRRWRAATIAAEPEAGAKDAVRLALNLPASLGAGRVVRRFAGRTTFEELYAFVECYDLLADGGPGEKAPAAEPEGYEHKYKFLISSLMPREEFEPSAAVTLSEKLGRGGNLIVEDED